MSVVLDVSHYECGDVVDELFQWIPGLLFVVLVTLSVDGHVHFAVGVDGPLLEVVHYKTLGVVLRVQTHFVVDWKVRTCKANHLLSVHEMTMINE